MRNALTIDLEEYFHPTEVNAFVDPAEWSSLPSRIERQTHQILDILRARNTRATFFVLGWLAEHHPRLVRSIAEAGHEIACHSFAHQLVYRLSPAEFRRDTERAAAAIADAAGAAPRIYRAPSYSITRDSMWALDVLVESGFTHDSSIYPIAHDRYGIPGAPRHAHVIETGSGPIIEVPAATAKLANGHVIPIGGGGYLRLLPYCYTAAGIRRVNFIEQMPVCIYFHPWEIDAGVPRLATGMISRTRTYAGLRRMAGKLERLLSDFCFSDFSEVYRNAVQPRNAAASFSGA
jgi:polysaccharide deacetylase family protein (PEP-CTERM system associated)